MNIGAVSEYFEAKTVFSLLIVRHTQGLYNS